MLLKLLRSLIISAFFMFLLISCPNDQMRDLVELKVSDPVADSFIINSGAPTSSRTVTLYSDVSKEEDALEMRFRNQDSSWSDWESYSPSKSWTLPIGDGVKIIYAEYRDEGHHVVSLQNNITLDTGAPAGPGFYVWGSGTEAGQIHDYINSQNCTLFMNVAGADRMRFSNTSVADSTAAWDAATPTVSYSDSYSWTLLSGDGSKTVYSQFLDAADNASYFTYSITLDTTAPSTSDFTINSGSSIASNTSASLTYTYTETNSLWAEYRNDSETWSSRESLSGGSVTKSWILRSVVGDRTVYLRLKDIAGNESVFSDQIYLDNAAPDNPSVTVNSVSYTYRPTWTWTGGGGGSGTYRYKLDNSDLESGATETAETTYTPSSDLSEGNHTLYVQEKDSAGNWSESGTDTTTVDATFSLNIGVTPVGGGTTSSNTTATLSIPVNISANPAAGYNFSHWQVASGSGVDFANANNANTQVTLTSGDATIQAVFTIKQYNLTITHTGYDSGNTATSPTGTITVTHGVSTDITAIPSTQSEFYRWEKISGTASIANTSSISTTVILGSDATISAVFSIGEHTVTFDTTGGSSIPSQIVYNANTVTQPADPVKSSFDFAGWYKDPSYSITWNFGSTLVTSDTTIYAKWTYKTYALRDIGPAGGLIFYDNPTWATDGWRYLEAAPVSTEWSGLQWGKYGTAIGGTSQDIGTGLSNTQAIVTGLAQAPAETGRAAQLCNSLFYNGYYDWFLPSRSEGYEMIRQLFPYDLGDFKSAAFPGVFYWTSSESGTTGEYANVVQVITGPDYDTDDHSKDNSSAGGSYTYYVRAIRRF